jgi:hypothetical protein
VAQVAKHDCEEEGEEDDGEGARIDFAVPRHAVRVDERLEAISKLAGRQAGRWSLRRNQDVEYRLGLAPCFQRGRAECGSHARERLRGHPALSDEDLAADIEVEQIEGVQRRRLARADVAPVRPLLRGREQDLSAVLPRGAEHLLEIADLLRQAGRERLGAAARTWRVHARVPGVARTWPGRGSARGLACRSRISIDCLSFKAPGYGKVEAPKWRQSFCSLEWSTLPE